jgi:hypothetical protein
MTKSRDSCLRRHIGLGGEKKPIRILAGGTIVSQTILINPFSISCHSFSSYYLPGVLLSHPLSQHPLIPAWFRPVPLGIAVWHIAMSLTSRVFGLFSTATSNSTAPVEDSSTPTWAHPIPTGGINDSYHTVRNDHALLEEEEPRPPYLHVQLSLATSHHCARADLIPNYRRCWLVVPEEHVATC